MILVIGAAGKTGQAVCRALLQRGVKVRALVRRASQVAEMGALGVEDCVIGDMADAGVLAQAFLGVEKVYHICSNMNPHEVTIGKEVIGAAIRARVLHFVYHSVLRPQVQAMPHHWNKLLVEEQLIQSDLPWTILQPAAYMQNLLGYWNGMMTEGVYAVPYSIDSRQSLVDLGDVAEAAAIVLTEEGHAYAEYEIVGPEALSARQIAERVSKITAHPIEARALDRLAWEARMRAAQMEPYAVETLIKMFTYYEKYEFIGNPQVLTWLLGRPPANFDDFIARQLNLSD